MTRYAKFISEDCIKYAPRTLKEQDFVCFNFNSASSEILNSRGYYEVIETNSIEDVQDETHYARPTYKLVQQAHTEVVEKTIVDENNEEQTTTETITVDDSYIECTYIAEEIVEEQE